MKKIIIVISLIFGFAGFNFNSDQNELLNLAYEQNSLKLFDQFLNNWELQQFDFNKGLERNTSNDTTNSVYEIFELLFHPIEWNKNRADSNMSVCFNGVRNVILPNEIKIKMNVYNSYKFPD